MAEDDLYTKDGTVDYLNNPANKTQTGKWKACLFILGNECCERLAYYGMSSNLVVYFKERLNQHSVTASNNVSNWSGTCYITTLIGAFVADAYLGRYWTIACFSIIYVIGMILLTLSASIPGLKPTCHDKDTCHAATTQVTFCFVSIYLIALGTGGIKPCVSSFGADQFDDMDEVEKKHKSSFFIWFYFSINIGALIAASVLVWTKTNAGWGWGFGIPAVAIAIAVAFFFLGVDQFDNTDEVGKKHKSSFFNWFYFSINIGALIAASVLVWVQTNVGWGWGFGIPAVAMAMAVAVFFSGTRLYRNQKPGGSPVTRICQVLVASFRNYRVEVPDDKSLLYETADAESAIKGSRKLEHTKGLGFFDKAAIIDTQSSSVDPWRLCTVTQVEELKAIVRLLPVWATGIVFAAVYSQMGTLFVLQGLTMDPHVGKSNFKIPAASFCIFDTLSIIFWVPIYDKIIVPATRKLTGHKNGLTQLQRMGTGLLISILAMIIAGILELVRLRYVRQHGYYELEHIPMSIFWQVPQYFVIGCAEVFMFIGQLEFFYDQAPDAVRSLCSALQLSTVALGSYLSTLLVTIVTRISTRGGRMGWISDNLNYGHLDYFYGLLAVLSVVNLGAFLVVARWYTYKKPVGCLR